MSSFSVMLVKEMLESYRSFKLLTILILMNVIGLFSPMIAKFTPELIKMLGAKSTGGFEILLTQEPSTVDALYQFHKNFALFPILLILMTMGTLSAERNKNIAPILLSKPIGRGAYVLAKFFTPVLISFVGLIFAGSGCLTYTTILFGEVWIPGFCMIMGLFMLYFAFYIAITVFLSSYLPTVGTALVAFGIYGLFSIASSFPVLAQFTPGGISLNIQSIIAGRDTVGLCSSIVITAFLASLSLFLACRKVRNYEL